MRINDWFHDRNFGYLKLVGRSLKELIFESYSKKDFSVYRRDGSTTKLTVAVFNSRIKNKATRSILVPA